MSAIFNVAGGLRYHIRGWLNSHRRWNPFRRALAGWLSEWAPGGETLLIVGASGGYCLEMNWLSNFREVVCLDPDPVARAIFSRRLRAAAPDTRLIWLFENFLSAKNPSQQLKMLDTFLGLRPGAPVLFSNFLGQLGLLMEEQGVDSGLALPYWKSKLSSGTLVGRPWASFHDRVSGEYAPSFEQPMTCPYRLKDEEIVSRLYQLPDQDVTLFDHDTAGLFPATNEHAYFHWALTQKVTHLIEATRS